MSVSSRRAKTKAVSDVTTDAPPPHNKPGRFDGWFSASPLRQALRPQQVSPAEALDLKALPHVLPRILRLISHHKARITLALLASIAATIFALALPVLLGRAVDQAHLLLPGATPADLLSGSAAGNALWITAGLLIAAASLRGLLTMLSGFQFEYIGQKLGLSLRLAYFEKLQRLDFGFHDSVHSGDLITRGMLDLEGMRMFVENGLQRIVSLALLLGIGATLMFRTDPLMALLSLSFVPFVIWRAFRTGLTLRLTWTRLQQRMSILTRTIEENLQGLRVVRAFAAKNHELTRFDQASGDALRMSNDRIAVRTGAVSSMTFAFYAAMALVLWYGGHRVAAGEMSVGHVAGFLTFMTLLQAPVRQMMMIVNTFARAISSGSRLFEILDREPAIHDTADAPDLRTEGNVLRFEQAGFRYEGAASDALSAINFEVRKGQTLGIVGPPGSGKSTLAQLLPRFYDVTSGRITIDGQDIRDVSLTSLRKAVAVVSQDVFLFDMTLRENVAYSTPDAPEAGITAAATTAQIHPHIQTLPQAYDTPAGERGVSLSGGQRQRLSIARGLIGDPSIVVFDDSTSAVDAATEAHLRAALQKGSKNRITLIIAHRLSALMHADEIIVLDKGRITERGNHAQLLARNGHYAALYHMQSGQRETHVRRTEPLRTLDIQVTT
ncbi:MAG: ABC transporter ATP-binding protein [Asticcacaulis sp.]